MMIDLILLVFVLAVFCTGFWAGAKFGTPKNAYARATAWLKSLAD